MPHYQIPVSLLIRGTACYPGHNTKYCSPTRQVSGARKYIILPLACLLYHHFFRESKVSICYWGTYPNACLAQGGAMRMAVMYFFLGSTCGNLATSNVPSAGLWAALTCNYHLLHLNRGLYINFHSPCLFSQCSCQGQQISKGSFWSPALLDTLCFINDPSIP